MTRWAKARQWAVLEWTQMQQQHRGERKRRVNNLCSGDGGMRDD
jgi:hypothetical protein